MSRTTVIVSAVFAAALGAAGMLLFLPGTGTGPEIDESPPADVRAKKAKKPRLRAEARKAPPRPRLAARASQTERDPRARREHLRRRLEAGPQGRRRLEEVRELRSLEGDDRAAKRDELRASRFERTEARINDIAETLAWDEPTTAEVIDRMREGHDGITAIMESVDRGEKTWNEARAEMRDARAEQADAVREILGDDGYDEFAGTMAARSMRERMPSPEAVPGAQLRARRGGLPPGAIRP